MAAAEPTPPPYKRTSGKGVRLPAVSRDGEFRDVLLARRTWRGFGRQPLSLEQLATLLDLTFGVQLEGETVDGSRVCFKTSPSGGACHPIEAYVLALRVRGLARGLYYYSPRTERLHAVRRHASAATIEQYLAGQSWYRNAGALVIMTALMPRVWWRYSHPRVYRGVLLEAGHFCQTFCLVSTWLGLAPFCTVALADSRIERDLRIDGINEVVLYAAGVGSQPADGRWVQWPGNRPLLPQPPRNRS